MEEAGDLKQISTLTEKARFLMNTDRREEAKAIFEELIGLCLGKQGLEYEAGLDYGYFGLAWYYLSLPDANKAKQILDQALTANSSLELTRLGMVDYIIYNDTKNLEEAEKILNQLLTKNPRMQMALERRLTLTYINFRLKKRGARLEELEKAFEEYFALYPDSLSSLIDYANIFINHRRDWAKAEAILLSILAKNPNDDRTLNNLGIIRYNQKKFDEATQLFVEALRLAPNNASYEKNLSSILKMRLPWQLKLYHYLLIIPILIIILPLLPIVTIWLGLRGRPLKWLGFLLLTELAVLAYLIYNPVAGSRLIWILVIFWLFGAASIVTKLIHWHDRQVAKNLKLDEFVKSYDPSI